VVRWLRRIAFALLLSLLVGLAIGTAIRLRLSRPTIYIGDASPSAPDALPLDVGHARAPVGDARHHEQEIG
jgi:hypothetical protein